MSFHPAGPMAAFLTRIVLFSVLALLPIATPVAGQWIQNGVPVCTVQGNQSEPSIVSDGTGGAIIVWSDGRAGSYVFAQRINSAGVPQWAAGGVLVSNPGFGAFSPVAVADGFGGAIVAYSEIHSSTDIYAQKINSAGATQWGGGLSICNAAGSQSDAAIVSDFRTTVIAPGSGAMITWTDSRAGNQDVYAQAVTGDGIVRWAANGLLIRTGANANYNPIIVTDGTGTVNQARGAFIAWHNIAGDFDVYAHRLNSAGVDQWAAGGTPIGSGSGNQFAPAAAYIGSSSAIMAWSNDAAVGSRVFAQRIGAGGWTPGGIQVSPVGVGGNEIAVISDGKGGAIIGWSDSSAGNQDIYAQRLDGSGNRRWTTNGVPVANAPDYQGNCVMVTDLAAGAIVIWRDDQPNLTMRDLYAQRVDSSGVARWNATGVPVSLGNGNKIDPVACPDGSGGAIVAWTDFRNTTGDNGNNRDVYAQHVSAGGGVVAVETTAAASFHLRSPAPNPARGPMEIRFELPAARVVTAEVWGIDGRRVATLALGVAFSAGPASLRWDGRGPNGEMVPSGVYFIRVAAGDEAVTRRALIVR